MWKILEVALCKLRTRRIPPKVPTRTQTQSLCTHSPVLQSLEKILKRRGHVAQCWWIHIPSRVPELESRLWCEFQLPAPALAGRQQAMAQGLGFPSPVWETWGGFLAPGLGLAQPWLWLLWGVNQQVDSLVSASFKWDKRNGWKGLWKRWRYWVDI